jgi:hypothetical protein
MSTTITKDEEANDTATTATTATAPTAPTATATVNDDDDAVVGTTSEKVVVVEKEEVSSGTTTTTTGGSSSEGETVMKGLFETLKDDDKAMLSFADGFRDKVKILFENFDIDQDDRLNYNELSSLQRATSPEEESLTKKMYLMVCTSLACHPDQGISLEALKFTYASDGADIDIDYDKVFNNTNTNTNENSKKKSSKKKKNKKDDDNDEDKIYEVGTNGVDISS